MIPLVAIVGRPNVGKSTLFNRLMGSRKAIVQDDPGVTRDRHYGVTRLEGRAIEIVDTGGFIPEAAEGIDARVREQAQVAIDEADLILLVLDARDGLLGGDQDLADLLRRTGKPVLHVANKVDGPKQEALGAEFYALGVERVLPVSAEHGLGLDDLVAEMLERLPPAPPDPADTPGAEGLVRVALVGRPNAGKSSLLNVLVGAERAIVSPEPGTTRDPVDARIEHRSGPFVIVDTAGIRRKRTKSTTMERYAIIRAERTIADADVVLLVIDAHAGVADGDAKLASLVAEAGRGLVLVLTKSDLLKRGREAGPTTAKVREQLEETLRFVSFAPRLFVSAVTSAGVHRLLPSARRVHASCGTRVPTAELNRLLAGIVAAHAPPTHRGRPVRLYFITQPRTYPPTFVISTNSVEGVTPSYRRYLANQIRARFVLEGAPLRLIVRQRRQSRE